jgi:hypothetical protein
MGNVLRNWLAIDAMAGESGIPELPSLKPVRFAAGSAEKLPQQREIGLIHEGDSRMLVQQCVEK